MAKCRIGDFAEAQVLQAIGADYIYVFGYLVDQVNHVDKWQFTVPFVCGDEAWPSKVFGGPGQAAMTCSRPAPATWSRQPGRRRSSTPICRLTTLRDEELFAAKSCRRPTGAGRRGGPGRQLPVRCPVLIDSAAASPPRPTRP